MRYYRRKYHFLMPAPSRRHFCCFGLCSCLGLLALCLILPAPVAAQGPAWGPLRRYGIFDQQRQLYRPNVHVVRAPGASRQLKAGSIQTVDYSVMRGFVSRIEVRSGLKIISTLPLSGPAQSGRLTFTVPTGLRDFKLWAWQGQPAYQSIHGESIKYTLIP